MSPVVWMLVAVLAVWMLACAWCGYARRFVLFIVVLCSGIALNSVWMMTALDANPVRGHALTAHLATLLYALTAVGAGWLLGRLVRQFRATQVEDSPGV
jgi:hypothetical protein